MSDPDRIYLEPEHNQIEGRMWCIDDDPASLGEPWTEYVRADLYAARAAELATMRGDRDEHFAGLVKCAERITELKAERDGYREALEKVIAAVRAVWSGPRLVSPPEATKEANRLWAELQTAVMSALDVLQPESEE